MNSRSMIDNQTLVLTDGERFFGQIWESMNQALRHPRFAMLAQLNGSINETICTFPDSDYAADGIQRARQILGLKLHAVLVSISGRGERAEFVLDSPSQPG